MTTTARRTMTIEEYSNYEGEGHVDLIEGELIEVAAGSLHGIVAARLDRYIGQFAEDHRLGLTMSSDTTFVLSVEGRTAVRPDVAFVRRERILALPDLAKDFPSAPDLAVEVVSPTDRATDANAKVRAYLAAGTPLVWVIDPLKRTTTVYSPDAPTRFLGEDDALDGGEVLPGFTLPLAKLFEI